MASLAEELATRHEVTVLTSRGPGSPSEVMENEVRVIRVPVYLRKQRAVASLVSMFSYIPQGIRIGRRLGKSTPFDVINTHFVLPSGPVGDNLAHAWGMPHVLSVHGGDVYDPSKFLSPHRHLVLRFAVRRLLRRAHTVIPNSQDTHGNIQRYYTPEIEGTCIPLGIRRPATNIGSREHYGLNSHHKLLITVGRLVSRKAVDQLITVMSKLQDEHARLLIIGSGPREQELRRHAAAIRVTPKVLFMGQVEEAEKYKILRMCDIYVSTSQHEGFGLVFLEAMASGLPIVCYDFGGHTDFQKNNVTGYVVALNDLDTFVDRCNTLVDTAPLRQKMSKHNLKLVESYYIDRCAAGYEEIFSTAIETWSRGIPQHH